MNFLRYMSYFMVTFFLVAGLYCIFSENLVEWLPGWRKYVMGAVLIAYGIARGSRIRNQMTQKQ
jgi:multisubunit Na+/H+ antiporter MnhC subunit